MEAIEARYYDKLEEGKTKDLNIILKGDVQGSVEAVTDAVVTFRFELDLKHGVASKNKPQAGEGGS
ncbi:MAG: hypothetical protein V3S06_04350 [candidate division Zixibacteria bacterium]